MAKFLFQRLALSLGVVALAACSPASAAWVLLDNFDGYSAGATTTATGGAWTAVTADTPRSNVVASDKGLSLESMGGAGWHGAKRDIGSTGAAVLIDEVQTYFWQVKASYTSDGSGWDHDLMMGLSPDVSNIDEVNAWQDFSVMPFVNNEVTSPFINADAPTSPWWAPMTPDQWYNVWVVIDNDSVDPTFDLYYSAGNDSPTLVAGDANWRNFAANLDLNAIGFMAQGNEGALQYIDNIYYAEGEGLLTNPTVPEPSSMVLVGLGGLALLACRRK